MGSGGQLVKDKKHTEMPPRLFCLCDNTDHDSLWVHDDGLLGAELHPQPVISTL